MKYVSFQEKDYKAFKKRSKNEQKLFEAELSSVKNKADVKRRKEENEIEMREKVCEMCLWSVACSRFVMLCRATPSFCIWLELGWFYYLKEQRFDWKCQFRIFVCDTSPVLPCLNIYWSF